MFTSAFAIFLGLVFVLAKLKRRLMLRLLHHDALLDIAVTVLVLCVHWGSFEAIDPLLPLANAPRRAAMWPIAVIQFADLSASNAALAALLSLKSHGRMTAMGHIAVIQFARVSGS